MPAVAVARLRPLHALAAVALLAACGDDSPTEPATLAGTYRATTFRAAIDGASPIDVLAGGGTLTLTIDADARTTGTLDIPAALTGGAPFRESMAGTAVRTGDVVRFRQDADTFVRDLAWSVSGRTLQVTDQQAGTTRFTIVLARQ